MQSSCYRCGAPVDEQTPFCSACGAPQIRVNVTQEVPLDSDLPATPPLEPGSPASVQPPAYPVQFDRSAAAAPRKRFLRDIWPFALVSGACLALFVPLGFILFAGSIFFGINRYRRNNPGPFSISDGIKLGVLNAILAFPAFVLLYTLLIVSKPQMVREALLRPIQQRAAQDPQLQELLRWASTHEGFVTLMVIGAIFFFILLLVLAAITGAIGASLKPNRRQP